MISSLVVFASLTLPPVMPVSQVQPGMRGECLTVFQGDTVEPFPFVVRGVMPNFLGPERDVVLIRLEGEKAEFTGVVAGMSGSPCSIEGKIVGALAYAFAQFAKEPIAGITPIDDMLDVMKLPEQERPWRIDGMSPTKHETSEWDALREGRPREAQAPKSTTLRPIATPLSLGGLPPAIFDHFAPWLESAGFVPVASGSAGASAKAIPLVPGSAVAAILVRGSVNIAATGTVTAVEGNQVLAFGHPFFGAGAVSIPMANASIVNTMASAQRSFKMSVPGAMLGEVTQDRLTAIGGYLGRVASMVPVSGSLKSPRGDARFDLEVARDLDLTPRFVAVGLAGALAGRVDAGERGTMRFTGRIEVDGLDPIVIKDVYSSPRDGNLMIYPAVDMAMAFATLWNTPFGPPPQIKMAVEADLSPEPVEEWIEAIHLDRGEVQPGQTMEVAVRLRRVHGPVSIERFLVQVPRSWSGEDVEIVAASARDADQLASNLGGDPRPTNLEQVGRWLSDRRADGNIYLMAVRSGAGMRADITVLPFLPPSIVATMSGDPNTQRRTRGLAWEERRVRPGIVVGGASATVKVEAR